MKDQYSSYILDIINKTSSRRAPRFQIGILDFLYNNRGCWVTHEVILQALKEKGLLSRRTSPQTARVQLQKSLNALDLKLDEYSKRSDSRPELRHLKIERIRGKGVRLLVPTIRRYKHQLLDWKEIHTLSKIVIPGDVRSLIPVIDIVGQYSEDLPQLYDPSWPLLELWEQLARKIWLFSGTRQTFVERYCDICLSTSNPFLKGQMAWGGNEFLERGREAILGYEIAERLLATGDKTVHRVLHVLCSLRPQLKRFLEEKGYQLPSADQEIIELGKLANAAIRRSEEWSKTTSKPSRLLESLFRSEVNELIGFWHTSKSGLGMGIAAMGYMKKVLRSVAQSTNRDADLIKELCLLILKKVDQEPDFSCFLAIEALEAVRDEAPAECAEVMGKYLLQVLKISLAFGIGVCACEGYEEGGENSSGAQRRFIHEGLIWKTTIKHPECQEHPLDIFFETAAESFTQNKQLDDVALWINQRLDLHPALA